MTALSEPLLTAADVARLLAIPTSSVYEYVRTERIPCVRIGRHVRFQLSDLEAWLQQQKETP